MHNALFWLTLSSSLNSEGSRWRVSSLFYNGIVASLKTDEEFLFVFVASWASMLFAAFFIHTNLSAVMNRDFQTVWTYEDMHKEFPAAAQHSKVMMNSSMLL